jgi:hypothetical protein
MKNKNGARVDFQQQIYITPRNKRLKILKVVLALFKKNQLSDRLIIVVFKKGLFFWYWNFIEVSS